MWFKQGAKLYTPDGKHVGNLDRVVIDPRSKEVTHLVVRKGLIFKEDHVLPVDLVASSDENEIQLEGDIQGLTNFPLYRENEYLLLSEDEVRDKAYQPGYAPPMLWYPGGLQVPMSGPGYVGHPIVAPTYPNTTQKEENIPDDTVALKEGAAVFDADGKEIGILREILVNEEDKRANYFIIAQGLLVKEDKLIPTQWVDKIEADKVYLTVPLGVVDRVPPYQGL